MSEASRIRAYGRGDLENYLAQSNETLLDPRFADAPHDLAAANASGAIFAYALGHPLGSVKEYARNALLAYRQLQARRRSLEELTRPRKGVRFDDSRTASAKSLDYLYLGLLARETELTRAIAENTWDPGKPVNNTIYPVFRLAYALRDLILDRPEAALSELAQVKPSAKKQELLQAKALVALATGASDEFSKAVGELARTHRTATNQEYLPQVKMFCLSAGGLSSLAVDRGLVTGKDLPDDVDCFPRELVLDGRA